MRFTRPVPCLGSICFEDILHTSSLGPRKAILTPKSYRWPPVNRALATSVYLLAPFLGPALGPAVGGFAAQDKGWRWTQWPILIVLGASGLYSLGMKETYMKIILQKKMTALNGVPPPKTGPSGLTALKFLLTVTLVRPVYMLFAEPIVGFLSVYIGFNFAVLFGCKSQFYCPLNANRRQKRE